VTEVIWTLPAEADLDFIAEHIAKDNASAAAYVVRTIRDAAAELTYFPRRGRRGRSPDTLELIITTMPYIVVYEVVREDVHVLRVWHQRQRGLGSRH
jgi:toxin ParE1/3/4